MNKKVLLEDVLEGYAFATPGGNDPVVLKQWMSDYPEFAEELMDFASMRAEIEHMPAPEISDEDTFRYKTKGLEMLGQFLESSKKKPVSISSLNRAAEEQGMDKQRFAAVLGISISLLMYLEKRRLEAASIPRTFIGKIADALRTTEESVAQYLAGTSRLSPNVSFKAESRPEIRSKQSARDEEEAEPLKSVLELEPSPESEEPARDVTLEDQKTPASPKKSFKEAVLEDQTLDANQKQALIELN